MNAFCLIIFVVGEADDGVRFGIVKEFMRITFTVTSNFCSTAYATAAAFYETE